MKPYKFLTTLVVLSLAACGTFEVGIERTPEANATAIVQFNAQVAASATALRLTALAGNIDATSTATPTPAVPVTAVSPIPTEPATATPPILKPTSPATQPPRSTSTPRPSPTVSPTPNVTPQIITFTVAPTTFQPGNTISIAWEAVGEHATLCFTGNWDEQTPDNCVEVPVTGSRRVTTNEKADLKEYFELRVYTGSTMTQAYAYVNVYCHDSKAWFFDYPHGCPATAISYSYAAAQRFAHGWMIWAKEPDTFYVLVEGQTGGTLPVWYMYNHLQLKPGASADNRVGETPPPGYLEPVSGFGLIWRGEVVGSEGLREKLGWAREAEFGFDTAYQYAQSSTGHTSLFLRGPGNKVFNLQTHMVIGWVWEELPQ